MKYSILTTGQEGGESDKPIGSGALWPERETGGLWEKSGFLVSALSTVLWQTRTTKHKDRKLRQNPRESLR